LGARVTNIRGIYTSAAKRELRNLFANFDPTRPISLGDYGVLRGDWFDVLGSLSEFGVSWKAKMSSSGLNHFSFVSSDSVQVNVHAKANAPNARANLEVKFGKSSGVFMDAAGCTYHAIESKRLLGEALRDVEGFERGWAVVTDAIVAKRTIVAISSNKNANIVFEAKAEVPNFQLADADVALSVSTRASVAYSVDAEQNLTPLIGLCKFQNRFLAGSSFQTLAVERGPDAADLEDEDLSDAEFLQLR
jgi:hypothetical protein